MIRVFASLLLVGSVAAGVVLLAVLNASAERPVRRPTPTATLTPLPTRPPATTAPAMPKQPAPSSSGPVAAKTENPEPRPTSSPTPSPSPAPEPTRLARIAHTGGMGVFLRREPSGTAGAITALRDGTQVAVLREEVTAARVWHLVRDPLQREGWVLADYLEFLPG